MSADPHPAPVVLMTPSGRVFSQAIAFQEVAAGLSVEDRELLADLLSGRDTDPTRMVDRARRQHADLDQPMVVAVAAVEGLDRHRATQVAARHAGELRGLGGSHEGHVVLVVPSIRSRARANVTGELPACPRIGGVVSSGRPR